MSTIEEDNKKKNGEIAGLCDHNSDNITPRIILKGNRGYIVDEYNRNFIDILDLELSYIMKGAAYSPKAKQGWDCRIRLLANNLSFPIGLLDIVEKTYISFNRKYIIDNKNIYVKAEPIDIEDNLKQINKVPRYYQRNAANVAFEKKRGIIKATTGCGKTLIAALIVAKAGVGKKTVVYVIGKDLLWQFHAFFTNVFNKKIGIIGDGECDIQDITIASIWTVGQVFGTKHSKEEDEQDEKKVDTKYFKMIQQFVEQSDVNILDECHLGAANTVQQIAAHFQGEYAIGLSASPYREDGADMLIQAVFGPIIFTIQATELIEQGYLVRPDIRFIPVRLPTEEEGLSNIANMKYKEIYKRYVSLFEYRNNLVVRAAKTLVKQGFVTMILFREINHGKILFEKLKEDNVHCYLLDGSDDIAERKRIVAEVESGKCNLLLASSIFDIGVDIPCLSGLVLAGGGKSVVRAIQRVGRVIRPYPSKTVAAIIEFQDNVKYLQEHSNLRRAIYMTEPGFSVS